MSLMWAKADVKCMSYCHTYNYVYQGNKLGILP